MEIEGGGEYPTGFSGARRLFVVFHIPVCYD